MKTDTAYSNEETADMECQAPMGDNGKIRIILADDHATMRLGLSTILESEADFELVAQAEDGREAVRFADAFDPDVILMDVSMPVMDGIEATQNIVRKHPGIRIIGLSMHNDTMTRQRMMSAGASAYIYKATPAEALINTIRRNVSPI